jgi:hypothetical protein
MAYPQPPRPNRDLAEIWRARLEKAKAAYDLSVAQFRRLSEEYRQQEMPRADSGFALRQAIAVEKEARRRYADVLRKFSDLIVNGTPPAED